MWTEIHGQINKLHVLSDGNTYRFRAGDIVQTTETAWESSYTWEYDGGTFSPQTVNAIPVQNGSIIYPPGLSGGVMFRAPFATWLVYEPPIANPTGYPAFLQSIPYESEPNGWQNLPGL